LVDKEASIHVNGMITRVILMIMIIMNGGIDGVNIDEMIKNCDDDNDNDDMMMLVMK